MNMTLRRTLILAAAVMAAAIAWFGTESSLRGLLSGTAVGMFTYALASAALFAPQLRKLLASRPF